MSEKKEFKFGKKQVIGVSIAAVLLIGGGSAYAVNNQKKAEAEKVELAEKKEKEDYQKLTLEVNDSVNKAYDTRSAKDIELAENIIKKLKEQDQKGPQEKMTKLHSFLDLIKKTDQLLATAEKSKKDNDIKAAQESINAEKDEYLKKDKEAHQKRLDQLTKAIKAQKEKYAKEKSEKEKAKKSEEQKQQAAASETTENGEKVSSEANASNPEKANENAANDQATQPAPTPAADQPVEQPTAPADNGNGGYVPAPSPEQPTTPTPAPTPTPVPQPQPEPTPTPTPTPQEPTPDNEPAGRRSPWFMSYGEAEAWAEANLTPDEYDRSGLATSSFSDGTIRYCVTVN
ncbi:hypothetical protein SFC81_01495 [Enterococcus faecalis]